jgi:hypothetical protein
MKLPSGALSLKRLLSSVRMAVVRSLRVFVEDIYEGGSINYLLEIDMIFFFNFLIKI